MSSVVRDFQDLVSQVPDLVQPLIVTAAGAIPFVEGELAAAIGVAGGLHPVVAAIAAMVGNLLSVTLLVLLGSRARAALVGRSGPGRKPRSARRQKFDRAFDRFGVPGVSLLGPALLPTHFTATALVASGVPKARVLGWQTVTIVLWTAAFTAIAAGVLNALIGCSPAACR